MFEWQSINWEDLLRQALLSLPFGYMVFEKVFATRIDGGKTYVVWDKLAPRMPRSIHKWAIGADNQPGVTQWRSDGTTIEIPMDKIVSSLTKGKATTVKAFPYYAPPTSIGSQEHVLQDRCHSI